MTELHIVSISPVPVATARPTASALPRAAAARNGTPQPNASPFQDALLLELGLGLDRPFPPDSGVTSAAADVGSALEPDADAAQSAAAAEAPLELALAGLPPLPSALASLLPPPASAVVPLSPAFTPSATGRAGLAPDPHKDPPVQTSATQEAELQSPFGPVAAKLAVPGKFSTVAAGDDVNASAAQKSELRLSISPAAVGSAMPGTFSPGAEREIRRDVAVDIGLPDRHRAAPPPSTAIHTGSAAPAQATQAPVAVLEARVAEHGWDQALGDKLIWMAGHRQQVAELHLNPPDLGPLKITLTLNHDQASAQFVSAHAPVREAIEAALPRLREMLADSGITLGDASVSTDAFREQAQPQHQPRAYPAAPAAAAAAADADSVTRGERLLRRSHGLVDTFA